MSDEQTEGIAVDRGVSPFRADERLVVFVVDSTLTTCCVLYLATLSLQGPPRRVVQAVLISALVVGSFLLPGMFRIRNELTPTLARQLFVWRVGGAVLFAAVGVVRTWLASPVSDVSVFVSLSVVVWWAIGGLVLGSIGGFMAARGRQRSRHADRLAEQTAVLNRVLRHDIRTTVNLIEGNLELVEPGTEAERERLSAAISDARALAAFSDRARTVQEVLRDDHSTSLVDLVPLVEETAAQLRNAHPEATITVEGTETALAATNTVVSEAIEELVRNAIQHHDRDSPTVTIELAEGERATEITVRDDGPGISSYESTVLARGEVDDLDHSSGMGLWLVRWIVDQSRGDLEIQRREPRGTAVTIRLPTP
jgi:signal transduction histidine kinase